MFTLSLCMILKNEERHIRRCLESVEGVFDEIVIVDTGSVDKTKEIAAEFTGNIYDFEWIEDFSAARNFAFEKATCDYIMWLDADDVLPENSCISLKNLKKNAPKSIDVYRLPYEISFDEMGNSTYTFQRERIIKNCQFAKWVGAIHEVITPFGKVVNINIPVQHRKIGEGDSDRNLRIYQKMEADGKFFSPRDKFYFARELFYHNKNEEAIGKFTEFLTEKGGWVENNIDACLIRAKCFKKIKKRDEGLFSLFESFAYDNPRAEICCEIGNFFVEEKKYTQAAFWYEAALNQEPDYTKGGFVLTDCYDYTPAIQLCVCYWNLGDREKAVEYNEKAAAFKETAAVQSNRDFFGKL